LIIAVPAEILAPDGGFKGEPMLGAVFGKRVKK
jgi:hypothetical protein